MKKNHGVDKQSQKEIDHYTSNHDKQTLPRRFGTELPRLHRFFHLLGVHALVYHTRNLHIASERKPTDTVRGLIVLALGKQTGKPLVFRTK